MVQYRDKEASQDLRRRRATALLQMCRSHRVPMLINDDLALAEELHADGVHLGQDDASLEEARARLPAEALIGASCYDDFTRAEVAVRAGASYVAFGSFHDSATKPRARRARISLLECARDTLPVPVCAIGGITGGNARALVSAGADLLAVCSGIFAQPDPACATRTLVRCFA